MKAGAIAITAAALVVAAIGTVLAVRGGKEEPGSFRGRQLNCLMELEVFDNDTDGLVTGYNYTLLKAFADSMGSTIVIRQATPASAWKDSLKAGALDIVAIPLGEAFCDDSIAFSTHVDSLTLWAVSRSRPAGLKEIDAWLECYHASPECSICHDLYMETHNPLKRSASDHLSPYDGIIRAEADTLGWDWRLLAAVIYQESHFRINAVSPKGARGLMQMMPQTAERFDVQNILDPQESIGAGVEFLCRLQRIFKPAAKNSTELKKIVLGAYNAGEGRIGEFVDRARQSGISRIGWNDIATQIDTLEGFRLGETVAYVDRVMELYREFCAICPLEEVTAPAQSVQDPLSK